MIWVCELPVSCFCCTKRQKMLGWACWRTCFLKRMLACPRMHLVELVYDSCFTKCLFVVEYVPFYRICWIWVVYVGFIVFICLRGSSMRFRPRRAFVHAWDSYEYVSQCQPLTCAMIRKCALVFLVCVLASCMPQTLPSLFQKELSEAPGCVPQGMTRSRTSLRRRLSSCVM